jgi:hypothetical protein
MATIEAVGESQAEGEEFSEPLSTLDVFKKA